MDAPVGGEKVYVQRLARQCLDRIVPVPEALVVPDKRLSGVENGAFVRALRSYQAILGRVYSDAGSDPARFGMACVDIDYGWHGRVLPAEARSRKSFFRLPAALLAIAQLGQWTGDRALCVDMDAFRSFGKFSKLEIILQRLTDYGFSLREPPGGPDGAACFIIGYPGDANIMAVLKAFGDVGHLERMLWADYRHLLSEKGYNEDFDIADMERMTTGASDKKLLRAIHDKLGALGCRHEIRCDGFSGSAKYFFGRERKETVVVHIDRGDEFAVSIRPLSVAKYAPELGGLCERVRSQCLGGRDCVHCGYCTTPHLFEYEGRSYEKCQIICCNFRLEGLEDSDIDSVLRLIDMEARYKPNKRA